MSVSVYLCETWQTETKIFFYTLLKTTPLKLFGLPRQKVAKKKTCIDECVRNFTYLPIDAVGVYATDVVVMDPWAP